MNDGTLSKNEIDALLTGTGDSLDTDPIPMMSGGSASSPVNTGDLSNLLEIVNFAAQQQANKLTELAQREVSFANVKAKVKDNYQIRNELTGKLIQIRMDYSAGMIGENVFAMRADDALRLVEVITRQSNVELSDVSLSSLSDGFIQITNASNAAMSDKSGRNIMVKPPQIDVMDDSSELRTPDEAQLVHISYSYKPEDTLPITLHQLISISLAKELINLAKGIIQEEGSILGEGADIDLGEDFRMGSGTLLNTIRPVRYQELLQGVSGESLSKNNIGLLLDISMQLTVELGRTKMQIKNILALGEGSIIELEKLAGEPVDLLVNGKLIAKGEVVVIDENFGVRITEIVSPHERLEQMITD
ncbi:MAG: flagellar motor switch protein FliN [Spirochaetota bacterium]|nr:flagellar motor switch protein FliN [Spirochaetota bacterium]